MRVTETELPGVLRVEPRVFGDARGFFLESFSVARYGEVGIPGPFVQDNMSASARGTVRGLHLQSPHPQGKLVWVVQGSVMDVAVDLRVGSPHFGRWVAEELSAENKRQLWVPPGFAHGFCVTSESAIFVYKCTEYYAPADELGLLWNDPELAIPWPVSEPVVSPKDRALPRLRDIDQSRLPRYA
jgi:dTDP-4-dehydrorhamnose 3,5-epimerase